MKKIVIARLRTSSDDLVITIGDKNYNKKNFWRVLKKEMNQDLKLQTRKWNSFAIWQAESSIKRISNKSILITRPNHDLINSYFFVWTDQVIKYVNKHKVKVLDLDKDKATKEQRDAAPAIWSNRKYQVSWGNSNTKVQHNCPCSLAAHFTCLFSRM